MVQPSSICEDRPTRGHLRRQSRRGCCRGTHEWPKRGPKWKLALQSCIDGFEGRVSPQEVRMAFEAAAREEGMLRSSG
ncbi:DUF982 domain-containing protein [Mesorhizobium sp. M0833]|uniref:DUF982 domain-containing protein n=1 Tax=Mesorhizobium sp. M0833 TaxID=2957009 RepID=UPI0033380865